MAVCASGAPEEGALLYEDTTRFSRVRHVGFRFGVFGELLPVDLIRRKAVEIDESQRDVIRALFWKEITDEPAAAASDDWRPTASILFEVCKPMWVQRVTNVTGNHHKYLD